MSEIFMSYCTICPFLSRVVTIHYPEPGTRVPVSALFSSSINNNSPVWWYSLPRFYPSRHDVLAWRMHRFMIIIHNNCTCAPLAITGYILLSIWLPLTSRNYLNYHELRRCLISFKSFSISDAPTQVIIWWWCASHPVNRLQLALWVMPPAPDLRSQMPAQHHM